MINQVAPIGTHRPTKLVIDLAAIRHNIANQLKLMDDNTELFAVIKANGYGHGIFEVATTAIQAGASGFCVAILDEALALRHQGFTQPILVLGIIAEETALLAADNNIAVTVGDREWLVGYQQLIAESEKKHAALKVHLALDTGMGRIGFREPIALKTTIDFLRNTSRIFDFEGMFTHFATADSPDNQYFLQQQQNWHRLVDGIEQTPRYVHISNSATGMWHPGINIDLVRFGIGMYGLNPSGGTIASPYPLEPALSLTTQISFVKEIEAGNSVGYGATYTSQQGEFVGTLPIGYADGYPRKLQGFHVLVDGQFCEIIGRICMDQIMVRLPKYYPVGTKVTLVGNDGGQSITMDQLADYAGTISYELCTGMAQRLDRVYLNE